MNQLRAEAGVHTGGVQPKRDPALEVLAAHNVAAIVAIGSGAEAGLKAIGEAAADADAAALKAKVRSHARRPCSMPYNLYRDDASSGA